jgi:hypothetical protein
MKAFVKIVLAASAVLSMTACAGGYGYGHHGGYASNDFVDGYYDDFYGPFDTGYWGPDDVFMYRGGDHQFHRDEGGHFRHGGGQGFHTFHGPRGHPG